MNFNNGFNNKNYFDLNKKEDKSAYNSKPVRKQLPKGIKPLYLIIFSVLILLLVFVIWYIYNAFSNSDDIIESNDIKAVFLVNEYDLSSFKGITNSGKLIIIKESNDDYQDICYNENYLYYVDSSNVVYSIDLRNNSFDEEELFSFNSMEVWDFQCSKDYIFVIGEGEVISFNIGSNNKKIINIDTDNNIAFSEDGLYVYYYDNTDNTILKRNISTSSEGAVLSNKLIVQGFGNNIFLSDDMSDVTDNKYFVYNIDNDETREVPIDLNMAYSYKDSIIYADENSLLEYSDSDEVNVLYTFANNSKVEGISSIVLLGNRLLIAAQLPAIDTTEVGNYEYNYYLFDLNTEKMIKLNNDYGFIIK